MAENWISMPELEALIGDDAARMLCAWHGGAPLYIPVAADPEHALARIAGMRAMGALCKVFGGEYVTVPNGRKREPHKSDVLDRLDAGTSHTSIALELGVTERYVRMVAAGMPKMRQLTLPFSRS